MDRRVADLGAEKEHGHAEPEDADPLEIHEGPWFSLRGPTWDDRGRVESAQVGLEVFLALLALVFLGLDPLLPSEGSKRVGACLPLRFFKEGAEGSKWGLPSDGRPLSSELHLLEGALPEAAEPAVECREVGLGGPGLGVLHRQAQAAGALKVRLREALDHGERKGLSGQEVHGKHSASGATRSATGKRDRDGLGPRRRDGLPVDP